MTWYFSVPELDIDYTRGDSRALGFAFTSGGAPRDLTDWTAIKMAVHSVASPEDETTIVLTMDGTLSADPTTGVMYLAPTDSDVTDVAPGVYFYDIQGTDTDDRIETLVRGKFRLNQDRTKD